MVKNKIDGNDYMPDMFILNDPKTITGGKIKNVENGGFINQCAETPC